jgi:Flp pilus assembly protein TadG
MTRTLRSSNGDHRVHHAGQALTEFAMVAGVFLFMIGTIIQFGLVLWSHNAATEIARDTARWAVTQSTSPCDTSRSAVAATANTLAMRSSLVGYSPGTWSSASVIASTGPEGVGVDWQSPDTPFIEDCPPSDNQTVWTVRVRINHVIPIFVPFTDWLAPSCSGAGWCISSDAELRMEPKNP